MLAEDLAGSKRSRDVRVHNVVPGLLRHRQRGLPFDLPRTVDQDIHLPERLHRSVQQSLQARTVTNIARYTKRPPPHALNRRRRGIHLLRPPGGSHDIGPRLRQAYRHR